MNPPDAAGMGDRTVRPAVGHALPASPCSPSLARGLLREAMATFPAQLVDTAQVLVSELVKNAIVHTQSLLTARITVDPPHVRVSVEDTSNDEPPLREAGRDANSGRELRLVAPLATAWEWHKALVGKCVWFES